MNVKAKQKWLELQEWENRHNCVVSSILEVSEFRDFFESTKARTDEEIFSALFHASQDHDPEYAILETTVYEAALQKLEK
jgi:hypothetical protein